MGFDKHRVLEFGALSLGLVIVVALFRFHPLRNAVLAQSEGLAQLYRVQLSDKVRSLVAHKRIGERGGFFQVPPAGPEVKASVDGGFYDRPLTVALSTEKNGSIYYTLDGSTPTRRSLFYKKPVFIDHSVVLSFRSFAADHLPGPVGSHAYIYEKKFRLPIVSLMIDPVFLWNKYSGIYTNWDKRGKAWRRPARVEYFDLPDSRPLEFPAEIAIHGNWSRRGEKKSFKLSYSQKALAARDSGQILNPPEITAERRTVVLRAAATDSSYRLGNDLARALYKSAGGLVAKAIRVMLILNGHPWGVYNLQEEIDSDYLRRRYGEGAYDLVDDAAHQDDSTSSWNRLLEFVTSHDLSKDAEFGRAAEMIDLDNLTDYWLFNIYAANLDWPQNNYNAFKKTGANQRWRWILWDADTAFRDGQGLMHNTVAWTTRGKSRPELMALDYGPGDPAEEFLESTAIIHNLLRNPTYRKTFINRFCDLLNSAFLPERVEAQLDQILAQLEPNLSVDWRRWPRSRESYFASVAGIRHFIAERPAILIKQFRENFRLGRPVSLTLKADPRHGAIQLNQLRPKRFPWTGRYFEKMRISLNALPAPGYEFAGWNDPSLGTEANTTVLVSGPQLIAARFRPQIQTSRSR